jgi:hypothetical protein
MLRGTISILLLSVVLCVAPSPAQTTRGNAQEPTAPPAQSQSWSGKLFDAPSKRINPLEKCAVTENTQAFGIQIANGSILFVDLEGNAKIRAALRDSGKKGGEVNVSVVGETDGDTINVDSVRIM